MGHLELDTYAVLPQPDVEGKYLIAPQDAFATEFANQATFLYEAVIDCGYSSFRGSAYDTVINQITGMSLLQQYIAPELVAQMSHSLEAIPYDDAMWGDISVKERYDLTRWFRICRQRGYALVGRARVISKRNAGCK